LHAVGATLSAAAFGALLGATGALLRAPWGSAGIALVVVAALAYLAREAFGLPIAVPALRRQVPVWWRTFFPFAPASFLYGAGLGVGFFTYLSHGTLVVVSVAAVASGRPFVGAALLAPFGLARGASAVVAWGARTPEASRRLVGRLADRASWRGWSLAHAVALGLVATAGTVWIASMGRPSRSDMAAAVAAVLAVTFAFAAVAKLARPRRWRRALASYKLPSLVERRARMGVPAVELSVAVLPVLGLVSLAGAVAATALAVFSLALVAVRVRGDARIACGCFGSVESRDYRGSLARNGVLLVVAMLAWMFGEDAWAGGRLGAPSGGEAIAAALVGIGLVVAMWTLAASFGALRRTART
jgi:methylamine utilization protein MauE